LSNHAMIHYVPNWCNTILKKLVSQGKLGKITKKITPEQTVKAKKVSDLIKIIINALP